MGQSNVAAGATIGSNHNSRANDGEILAGRGFWPGLCVTLKHNCRFASYTLLAKGDYPAELDVPLPFALINDNAPKTACRSCPPTGGCYNMYALARNTWKFLSRDKRKTKTQHIEFDCLAPDTAEEIFRARELLQRWVARAWQRSGGAETAGGKATLRRGREAEADDEEQLESLGRRLLDDPAAAIEDLEVLGEGLENSPRKAVILKARQADRAYREMLHHYAMKNLLAWLEEHPAASPSAMIAALAGPRKREWVNLGGLLAPAEEVDALHDDVRSGKLDSWRDIHARYDRLWEGYPLEKQRHAWPCSWICTASSGPPPSIGRTGWTKRRRIQEYICEQVYQSRKKLRRSLPPHHVPQLPRDGERAGQRGKQRLRAQVRQETAALAERIASVRGRGF